MFDCVFVLVRDAVAKGELKGIVEESEDVIKSTSMRNVDLTINLVAKSFYGHHIRETMSNRPSAS